MITKQGFCNLVGVSFLFAGVAAAQNADFKWSARTGAVYSDNVNRSASNELDSLAAVAGVQIDGLRQTGRLRFDLTGQLDYYHYLESSVDGELIGAVRGQGTYDIIPEKLEWGLDGSFDQQRGNAFLPAAPGNREDVLTLSTGPTWRARFGDAFSAVVRARYSDASYSEQSLDNNTTSLSVVVERRLSALAAIGVGASFSDVSYDTSAAFNIADVERRELFATGRMTGARTDLSIEAGFATLDNGTTDTSDPVLRASVTRRLSPFLSARLDVSQQYPTTENTRGSLATIGSIGGRAILSSAPRKQQSGSLGLTYSRARTSVDVAAVTNREEGVFGLTGERKTNSLRAIVSRTLTPRSRGSLSAEYLKDDLPVALGKSTETILGAVYSYSIGAKLSLDAQAQMRNRDADFAAGSGDELSFGVFLRYGRTNTRALVDFPTR